MSKKLTRGLKGRRRRKRMSGKPNKNKKEK